MSRRDKLTTICIDQMSALMIVEALSKVAIEELAKEMKYDGEPWRRKPRYLSLISDFANAAEVMCECENDEFYICHLPERPKMGKKVSD